MWAQVLFESLTQPGPCMVPSSEEQVSYSPLRDYETTPDLLPHMVCDRPLCHSTAFVSLEPGCQIVWPVSDRECNMRRGKVRAHHWRHQHIHWELSFLSMSQIVGSVVGARMKRCVIGRSSLFQIIVPFTTTSKQWFGRLVNKGPTKTFNHAIRFGIMGWCAFSYSQNGDTASTPPWLQTADPDHCEVFPEYCVLTHSSQTNIVLQTGLFA